MAQHVIRFSQQQELQVAGTSPLVLSYPQAVRAHLQPRASKGCADALQDFAELGPLCRCKGEVKRHRAQVSALSHDGMGPSLQSRGAQQGPLPHHLCEARKVGVL